MQEKAEVLAIIQLIFFFLYISIDAEVVYSDISTYAQLSSWEKSDENIKP